MTHNGYWWLVRWVMKWVTPMTHEMTRLNTNNNSHNQIKSKRSATRKSIGKTKYITMKKDNSKHVVSKKKWEKHENRSTRPLNELLEKDRKFKWTTKCQQAFDNLKTRFTSEPVLIMPDQTKPFQIECDASKYASGAVLTQLDSNGDRHPCAFISKTFSPAERNYEIYDRELLAIIRALEEWRHYIQGSPHTTIVFSDHKNLTYFQDARKLNQRQSQWSLYLSEFDVKFVERV